MTERAVPRIWGIVNVTPDSFSDGGRHATREAAVAHALRLVEQGADVLDVGGESTRPGANAVSADLERSRVLPVIEAIQRRGLGVPISVDTRKAVVAADALDAGATIVNDVSGGTHDEGMLETVGCRGAGLVLMHMQGAPGTMQDEPRYDDVVAEVRAWLARRVEAARAAGVGEEALLVDPGIGFGKTLAHNLALFQALEQLVGDGPAVLLGASRKSFLGRLTGREAVDRVAGSLACAARAWEAGVAAVRVHDVAETRDLFTVLDRVGFNCR